MIRRAFNAYYDWLAVEFEFGGRTWVGTDAFGAGAVVGAVVAMFIFGG